ncbi:MAG: glycosyltransferase [Nanoarchaeota archaeon]|nr:glycosyltransferase [Nanoarchaeota archaeon]
MKALILAGGRGSRLDEFTKDKNKSMIKLFEKPLIEYNLEHAIKARVSEIIIVVGYKKEEIIKYVGKEYRGVKVTYAIQKKQKGVVNAIECARPYIRDSDFILMLGDEIVVNAKTEEMLKKFREEELFAICGITIEKDKSSISKTYSAMVNETGRVFRLIEKPKFPINKIKGTGHCIFKNEILRYIGKTPISMKRGEKELVDMIQEAIDEGKKVQVYHLTEGYVNVNTEEDLRLAEEKIKKENPKILIVHTQMRFLGGAELLIVELANWLTKRGIKNDILALSKSKEVENKLINTNIIIPNHNIDLRPPGFKNSKDILSFVKIYRKELKRLIKSYDVINFHNFPVTWTLFPRRKPNVWMLNEPPSLWSRPNAGFILKSMNNIRNWFDKFIVRNFINVICVADEFNKKRTQERYGRDSKIVYYGVNYDFFSKGNSKKARDKWSLKGKFVVVQSGMITKTKNQLESIKTISKVKNDIPNIFLVLAGTWEEDYKREIDEFIKNQKLEKYVLFAGNLDREDLRDLYKASDVGIYPIGKQGGWLAPFEHLCGGNPIIVSKELGAASVIKKFELGIITKDYSNALLEIYKNINKYKRENERRRKIIEKNLGWDVFTDKMIQAYKDAWKKYY